MKAVIMAGGRGTRLYPLTQDIPKPLMQIMGRPLVDHMVEHLRGQGCDEIILTLGHQCQKLLSHLDETDYSPTRVYCAVEEYPLGTAGSVRNAESLLEETFFVLSGDAVTDVDVSAALAYHRQKGGLLTILLAEVEDVRQFGMVVPSPDGRVIDFREKPRTAQEIVSQMANTGMYVIEPEVLGLIPTRTYFDFARDLFPLMLSNGLPIYGWEMQGYWCDVGTLHEYWGAHRDVMAGRVNLPRVWSDRGHSFFAAESATIDPSVQIEGPVCVGPGVTVEAGARLGPFTMLAANVRVGAETQIEDSVVNADVVVGSGSRVQGSIIGHGTRVPKGSRIISAAVKGYVTVGIAGARTEGPPLTIGPRQPRGLSPASVG